MNNMYTKTILLLAFSTLAATGAARAQEKHYASLLNASSRLPAADTRQQLALASVLQEIEDRYRISIVYESTLVEGKYVLQSAGSSASVEETLEKLLVPFSLTVKKLDTAVYLIVKEKPQTDTGASLPRLPTLETIAQSLALGRILITPAPKLTIGGRVTDENQEPLPGVNVVVKGTSLGAITNPDGRYSLTVPDEQANGMLVFSFIGYLSEEIPINNRTQINISLAPDIKSLEEVVVVGYGTVKKSDLTGAVASVRPEQLTAYPAIGAVQALQGRAPGVQIQANNGEPGASFKVRVRGGTSINASSDPIYVVDGFIGAALPPPEDIASVEVLKDASATAIYGSRGANGVIMITTRRGQSGKARIEFNTSYSMQNEINRLDLLNAQQFQEYIAEVRPNIAPLTGNTDWQDQIFRTGGIQNYQLSLSGGTDAVNYYVSGAYFDQKGVIIGSGFNRFSVTSNIDLKASERLRVGLNVFAQRTNQDGTRTQEGSGGANNTGVIASAFKFEPDQPVRDENGRFTVARLNDRHDNPYAIATQFVNESVNDRMQGNAFAEFDLLKNLKFRTTFGATTNSGRTGIFTPTTLNAGLTVGGRATVEGRRNTLLLNENYLTYNLRLGAAHDISVMGGYSFQDSRSEFWSGTGQSFVTDAVSFWNMDGSSVWQSPGSSLSDWRLSSFYGRVNYALADRYLFTVNMRYDGSSNFSRNHKWAFFPSGAFAWKMSSEPFMQNIDAISQWKWRVSYGLTGNQAIEPYQTLARFGTVFTVVNGNPVNAVRPTTVANNDLTWETTAQVNAGTDISFFKDRLGLTVDYYRMVTRDLLFSVNLPQYSGYSSQLQNVGAVENKGLEFALNSRNLVGAFTWSMDVNFSLNRNKVLRLPGGNEIQYGSGPGHMVGLGATQILREGYPVGSFFGWIYDGVYQEGDDFLPGGGFEQAPGGERFRDIDGQKDANGNLTGLPDGLLNSDDRTIIGNPHPDFIWGWNNDFSWKNFDLNIFFQGSQGNDVLSYTLMELDLLSGINNATTNALRRWTPQNTDTDVPRAFNGRTRRVSTRWIYDGSFARLKNIALGYNLPKPVVERLKLQRLRIYVSAQNILTLTNYEGYDPEVNYSSGGNVNGNRNLGLDYGSYPNAKSYTIGINIGL